MTTLIKYVFNCFLILLVSPDRLLSQQLSVDANRVKQAWEKLSQSPNSKEAQLIYVNTFPDSKKLFMEIFQPDDFKQLYPDSHKYVDSFAGSAKYYPREVIGKSVNIGKDLVWEADATGELQYAIVELGSKYPMLFSNKVKTLSATEIDRLVKFLSDIENFQAFPEYQRLIDSLNKTGSTSLANKFIKARELRKKVKE